MKNYFKKFSIMFMMVLMLSAGFCVSAFADDIYTDNLIPKMTSNTNPSGKVTCSSTWDSNTWLGYRAFDKSIDNLGWCTANGYPNGWLEYEFEAPKKITQYTIAASTVQNNAPPKSWTFEGSNDGVSWTKLDSRNNETNWRDNEKRFYQFNNNISYKFYKINISNSNNPKYCVISELEMMEKVNNITGIALDKPSVVLAILDSQQLTATTTPAGAQVTWKSSDTSIATVDSTGKVTAMKDGTCTITATTSDGLTATCVVTVIPKGTDPILEDKIVNIAHAKGDNTNNAGGDVTIIFHGSADTTLSVVKTADVKDVWVGDNFTYTIVVTNTGTKTAKAVIVSDPAPNHIDFNVNGVTTTQGTVDSSSTSKNIIVNVGDIPPAGTVTIKVPATVIA
ncbi:Ig-like domain-containing protein [Clostridium sp. YIM B02555]|uniref:Ig-like domain-containing protein n=1 Tax=Clostridium sp. YIM B02555 TaxID=2911968 RepID=UPI001EEEE568|nr:Ig-like domain-containing protein [Clostridium sp. YIM B02555]